MLWYCVFLVTIQYAASASNGIVAFTEAQTAHMHLTQGEILTFNKVITNIGSGIGPSGIFTCSTPGLYAFHFYALTRSNGNLWLELFLNGHLVESTFGHSMGTYADCGNSAMLHLKAGDEVYIKAHDSFDNALYGAADQIYTTFTGVLLDSGSFRLYVRSTAKVIYGREKLRKKEKPENAELNRNVDVGFSVALTNNVTLNTGDKVPFNIPIINGIVTQYNLNTGDFVAAHDGTYIFHFHGLASGNQEVWLELYHNSQYVVTAYGYTANLKADAGNTAILNLRKGDVVNIKSGNDGVTLYGSASEKYSTFSGALLALTTHGPNAIAPVEGAHEEVSFSVGLVHNINFTSYSQTKVLYDRIFNNLNNDYDMKTGVFTAPVNGVYVFHYHALSETGEEVWLELYHNYIYVNSLYAYDANSYAGGSNAATLQLTAGDQVFINMEGFTVLYGRPAEIYCTFSGYLLAPVTEFHSVVG